MLLGSVILSEVKNLLFFVIVAVIVVGSVILCVAKNLLIENPK